MKRKLKAIQYRRKRAGKTNYKKRISLLKSGKNRIVIRKSLTSINVQLVKYETKGDKIIVGVNSKSLTKMGWNYSTKNLPACYLTGYLFGKKISGDNIVDLGMQHSLKGSKVYALLKGIIDSGIILKIEESMFPSEERLLGTHISNYFEKDQNNFKKYVANKVDVTKIKTDIVNIKKKIDAEVKK